MKICTAVSLIALQPSFWETPWDATGVSLQQVQTEVTRCARKLGKGFAVADERLELPALARLSQAAAAKLAEKALVSAVPETLIDEWDILLEKLASDRSRRAEVSQGKSYVLPFLPVLFGPSQVGTEKHPRYDSNDVASHVQELHEFQTRGGAVIDSCAKAIQFRERVFREAFAAGAGLVEWVQPLPCVFPGAP